MQYPVNISGSSLFPGFSVEKNIFRLTSHAMRAIIISERGIKENHSGGKRYEI